MADVIPPAAGTAAPAGAPSTSVTVSGVRLDRSCVAAVRADLDTAVATGTGDVVIDLSRVEWVDATGLAVLVAAHRRLRSQQRRLVLCGCGPRVRRALAVTRLNRILTLEPSLGAL